MTLKKILLFSAQYNSSYVAAKKSTTSRRIGWYDLILWQARYNLRVMFPDDQVDLISWGDCKDNPNLFRQYDMAVAMEFAFAPHYRSPVKRPFFNALEKFKGEKYCLFPGLFGVETGTDYWKKWFKAYYKNDLTSEYLKIEEAKPNIVFGTDVALNLWTPDTQIRLMSNFEFDTSREYDTATVYFDAYDFDSEHQFIKLVDNLCQKIEGIQAKKKVFMLPTWQPDFYVVEFGTHLIQQVSKVVDEIKEQKFSRRSGLQNPWRYRVWDYDKNELRNVKYVKVK